MPASSPAVTLSATVDAPPTIVYAFVSDPRNLPRWAAGLAKSVEYRDGQWVVDSGAGEWMVAFVGENALGVADHVVTLPDGTQQLNPMRVVANGSGSEVLFTVFRGEVESEDAWVALQATIQADLDSLAATLAAEA